MRRILKIAAGMAALCLLAYGVLFYQNSYRTASVDKQTIQGALERSKDWVVENESALLRIHNPALWQMLRKLNRRSPDERIAALIEKYKTLSRMSYRGSALEFQVYGSGTADYQKVDLSAYPDYNLLFMYGHECDPFMGQLASVQAQLRDNFCDTHHRFSPACKTHQLMGMLSVNQNQCIDDATSKAVIAHLATDIERQLTYDVRVVDVYHQRVMMLFEAGRPGAVRATWISNIIENQNADGGWGDFDALLPLPGQRRFGFSARAFQVGREKSYFHTTAQGALLLAYALDDWPAISTN